MEYKQKIEQITKGIKKQELAAKLNVSRATLWTWLKNPDEKIFNKIKAAATDISGISQIIFEDQVRGNLYPILKSIDTDKLFENNNVFGLYPFRYRKQDNCFLYIVTDDSMTSMGSRISFIKDDLLLIDIDEEIIDGDYSLILLKNKRVLFREYVKENDHIILRPNNRKYSESVIHSDDISTIYRVCGYIREQTF